MNNDKQCDSCGREVDDLYLTTYYEMLCACCLRDQCQYELKDYLGEKEYHDEYVSKMKNVWKDIKEKYPDKKQSKRFKN
jgi:hypothetical protein